MAEEAPAAAPAKVPKKKAAAPRPKKEGPSLPKLITAAVTESKERKGMSLAAIKKVLGNKGVDLTKSNKRINIAVTKLVARGTLTRTKGTGASGSFKLGKEPKPVKKVAKKAPVKAKKPAAKKTAAKKPAAKKPAAKKPAAKKPAAKKPAAKKPAAKKPAAKKSPKKKAAKKPAAKSTPKKAAPKKVKAVKKPAAKKTPVKKAAAKKSKK